MANKKNLTDIGKKMEAWFFKINFLEGQIHKLELLKDFPIFSISAFLLKCQFIEFRLRQLLFSLDLHIKFNNSSQLVKLNARDPKDMDMFTLGRLVFEYKMFAGENLEELNANLKQLHKLRNDFTHHLFSNDKDTSQISSDAEKGIKIANLILKLLEDLDNKLHQNL